MKTSNTSVRPRDEAELLAFWKSVTDRRSIGLANAFAEDIAEFRSEPIDHVLQRMAQGTVEFRELWQASNVDVTNPRAIAEFYRDQFTEAYELANWHAGRTIGLPPLHYAAAALLARKRGLVRALDFGSGIGTGSMCLAHVGCEVHSADIAQQLLAFVDFRMRKHGFRPRPIDLASGALPEKGYFDLITCFDVLEHIPNQLAKLAELSTYLRPGGHLIVNMMQDSSDPDRPMHISSAGDWLSMVRRTNLVPDWAVYCGGAAVLIRGRHGRVWNLAGATMDRIQRKRPRLIQTATR